MTDGVSRVSVLRAARSLLGICRAPAGVVSRTERLDHVQTTLLSLAATSDDPRVMALLLLEVGEIAARLSFAIEDVAGNAGVQDALAGRPLRVRATGRPS